jgi:hypothetical protein
MFGQGVDRMNIGEQGSMNLLTGSHTTSSGLRPSRLIRVVKNNDEDSSTEIGGLDETAESEHEYLHEKLRAELGREPTEEELDEWLRRHTESY